MKIYVCWKMRRARCWPLTFRGALFWCLHATLSSLMMVILLFHCAASESEGDMELTLLCDVTCIAPWSYAAEGAPVWSSFGEWGRLFASHLQPAWICVNEGDGWCSSHTQSMMMLHPGCSPCWSCQEYAVHVGAAVQEYVVHDGAAVLDAMLLYGVGTTKFGNVSTKVGPPGLAMPQV